MYKNLSNIIRGLNVGRASAVLALGATLGATLFSGSAEATPAFARQMDMNCMGCHTQALTTLNSFGRTFKLSGYSMASGDKSMITGGTLRTSLPLAVNAGIGIKANYVSSDDPVVRDNLSLPAGSAIFFGGKVAENAGAQTMWNGDGLIHMQATFAQPVGLAAPAYRYTAGRAMAPSSPPSPTTPACTRNCRCSRTSYGPTQPRPLEWGLRPRQRSHGLLWRPRADRHRRRLGQRLQHLLQQQGPGYRTASINPCSASPTICRPWPGGK